MIVATLNLNAFICQKLLMSDNPAKLTTSAFLREFVTGQRNQNPDLGLREAVLDSREEEFALTISKEVKKSGVERLTGIFNLLTPSEWLTRSGKLNYIIEQADIKLITHIMDELMLTMVKFASVPDKQLASIYRIDSKMIIFHSLKRLKFLIQKNKDPELANEKYIEKLYENFFKGLAAEELNLAKESSSIILDTMFDHNVHNLSNPPRDKIDAFLEGFIKYVFRIPVSGSNKSSNLAVRNNLAKNISIEFWQQNSQLFVEFATKHASFENLSNLSAEKLELLIYTLNNPIGTSEGHMKIADLDKKLAKEFSGFVGSKLRHRAIPKEIGAKNSSLYYYHLLINTSLYGFFVKNSSLFPAFLAKVSSELFTVGFSPLPRLRLENPVLGLSPTKFGIYDTVSLRKIFTIFSSSEHSQLKSDFVRGFISTIKYFKANGEYYRGSVDKFAAQALLEFLKVFNQSYWVESGKDFEHVITKLPVQLLYVVFDTYRIGENDFFSKQQLAIIINRIIADNNLKLANSLGYSIEKSYWEKDPDNYVLLLEFIKKCKSSTDYKKGTIESVARLGYESSSTMKQNTEYPVVGSLPMLKENKPSSLKLFGGFFN